MFGIYKHFVCILHVAICVDFFFVFLFSLTVQVSKKAVESNAELSHWPKSLELCCMSDQPELYARTLCVLCPAADPQEAVLEDKVNAEVKLYIHDCLKVSIFQQTPDSTEPQCGCCQVSS